MMILINIGKVLSLANFLTVRRYMLKRQQALNRPCSIPPTVTGTGLGFEMSGAA